MKNFFYLLILLVACYWLYNKCSHKDSANNDVSRQVKVAVKIANLRKGPGTGYDFVVDSAGVKQQVKQGTVLNVVSESNGWYQVRLDNDTTLIAYIKQSLCTGQNGGTKSVKKKRTGNSHRTVPADVSKSTPSGSSSFSASSPTPVADGVEEEVTNETGSDDEVIF